MYSLRCFQCGSGFLSSYNLEAPICGKCIQKAKSLDSTIDNENLCNKCGITGVIYGKEMCHSAILDSKRRMKERFCDSDRNRLVLVLGMNSTTLTLLHIP